MKVTPHLSLCNTATIPNFGNSASDCTEADREEFLQKDDLLNKTRITCIHGEGIN